MNRELFWIAIGAIWALVAWFAAVFYFIWTIKLVRTTQKSIAIGQEQLLILKNQIDQEREYSKIEQQKYRYEKISEFETWDRPSRIRVRCKKDNHLWFASIFPAAVHGSPVWHWSFTPDVAPEKEELHYVSFESKWKVAQQIKQQYYYTYHGKSMNDDWSFHDWN